MLRFSMAAFAASLVAATAFAAPPPRTTLQDADDVLSDLQSIPEKGIPPALLADAHAVIVIPRVVKAGFVIGGRGGHGVALVKASDGTWGEPTFVNLGGASLGFQAGVQSSEVVLVLKSKKSLERLLDGKSKLTLGADASVAAGPVGRQLEAGTDAKLQAEIISYSRSRGLFAGVALNGAVIANDRETNYEYLQSYKQPATAKALDQLKAHLTEMSSPKGVEPARIPPSKK